MIRLGQVAMDAAGYAQQPCGIGRNTSSARLSAGPAALLAKCCTDELVPDGAGESVQEQGHRRANPWPDGVPEDAEQIGVQRPMNPCLALAVVAVLVSVMLAAPSAAESPGGAQKTPKRLSRADSFLGVHFDFHAAKDCTEIGRNTTRAMVEEILDLVRPDYVQTDCKGHPGLSSYPTKVGNQAPGFVGDPLRVWREVTAERGVGLYMHYSGVWDIEAAAKNPTWAAVNADGSRNPNAVSVFGPYVDRLLIPQLRELASVYGVDGAWVDGECWATVPDYGEAARKAFRAATGIETAPQGPRDSGWYEWLQFHREAFRNYLRHYIAEVRRTNPAMQICSNWAFSDHMPEAVTVPVDWISGDFSPENAVNSARVSARYLADQGKPWDLMAWSFAHAAGREGWVQKPAAQLQREAAVVLAMGGGFQCYFTQRRDGSVKLDEMPVMAEVARFCRERQRVCHRAKQVPQVALLYSTANHYRRANGLFPRDHSWFQGTLQALVESQYSVELMGEHQLKGRMRSYPLIVLPEVTHLDEGFKAEVVRYVRGGGRVLLIGKETADLFRAELDKAEPLPDAVDSPARIATVGKGRMLATNAPFSAAYLADSNAEARRSLDRLVRVLFPTPMVDVAGSNDVDVVINKARGGLAVNLINTSGPHADPANGIIDRIAPVGPLSITVRMARKPTVVRMEPEGRNMPFEYRDGQVHVEVPELDIHCVLVVR